MTLVVPNISGEILMLQYIVGLVNADNPVLHLFSNDVTPSDSTVIGDLTEVSGSTGYQAITLVSSNWTTTQSMGITTAVYSSQTFNFTTGVTTYGYYLSTETGQLLWLERFSGGPFVYPDSGGNCSVAAKLGLS